MNPDRTEIAAEYQSSIRHLSDGTRGLILHAFREGHPEALGLTRREWVLETFGGYVQLPLDERREVARELVEVEGLSQREAADVLGVDHRTVGRDVGASAPFELDYQDEPAERGASAPKPDPEREARRREERDAREREEGLVEMAWTVRRALAVLGNPSSRQWLPERLAAIDPPLVERERSEAIATLQLLGETP